MKGRPMLSGHQLQRYTASKSSLDPNEYFFVRYRLNKSAQSVDFDHLSVQLALSISLGSVRALPFENEGGRRRYAALVVGLEAVDAESVSLELAIHIAQCGVEAGLPHLCTVICYPSEFVYAGSFWIESIELPPAILARLPGPQFGAQSIMSKFNLKRPLFGIVTKPRMGTSAQVVSEKVKEALEGGADVVIDDELLHSSMPDCSFSERVKRFVEICQTVEQRVGHPKHYIPNVTGPPSQVRNQIEIATQIGAFGVQVNSFSLGLGGLVDLVTEHRVTVPIIDCAIGIGLLARPPFVNGISETVWAYFSRMSGADGYYTGIPGTHVWYSARAVRRTLHAITDDIADKRAALPVGASGLNPANIWKAASELGANSLLLSGTGILSYASGPRLPCECIKRILTEIPFDTPPDDAHAAIQKLGEQDKRIARVLDSYKYGIAKQ